MTEDVCKGCGSALEETGAPIWETYCSNDACTFERDQLFASVRARVKLNGWEPIATAPRDGTRVLLWTDTSAGDADLKSYVENVCEDEHFALAQVGQWGGSEGWQKALIGEPTHWRPLPEPPQP